jgi:hypothetical protein
MTPGSDTDPKASYEYILGQIDGKLGGICREIKEIKEGQKCQSDDCQKCRDGLKKRMDQGDQGVASAADALATRLEEDEKALKTLQDGKNAETAVVGFLDKTGMKVYYTIASVGGLITLVLLVWHYFLGGPPVS